MDPALSYYQSLSSVSFTLLGLWFTVLGLSHGGGAATRCCTGARCTSRCTSSCPG